MVELVTVSMPALKMPPPMLAEFPVDGGVGDRQCAAVGVPPPALSPLSADIEPSCRRWWSR